MDFAREGWCTRATSGHPLGSRRGEAGVRARGSARGSAWGRTIFAGVPCVRRGGRERVCVAKRAMPLNGHFAAIFQGSIHCFLSRLDECARVARDETDCAGVEDASSTRGC